MKFRDFVSIGLTYSLLLFHGIFLTNNSVQLVSTSSNLFSGDSWKFCAYYGKWHGLSGLAKMFWTMGSTNGGEFFAERLQGYFSNETGKKS